MLINFDPSKNHVHSRDTMKLNDIQALKTTNMKLKHLEKVLKIKPTEARLDLQDSLFRPFL